MDGTYNKYMVGKLGGNVIVLNAHLLLHGLDKDDALNLIGWIATLSEITSDEIREFMEQLG